MPFAKITRPIIAPSKPRGLLNCIPKMCKKHSEIEVPERLPDDFLSRDIVLLLSVKSIRRPVPTLARGITYASPKTHESSTPLSSIRWASS